MSEASGAHITYLTLRLGRMSHIHTHSTTTQYYYQSESATISRQNIDLQHQVGYTHDGHCADHWNPHETLPR